MYPGVPRMVDGIRMVVVEGTFGPPGRGSCSLAMPTSASLAALDLHEGQAGRL